MTTEERKMLKIKQYCYRKVYTARLGKRLLVFAFGLKDGRNNRTDTVDILERLRKWN